MSRAFRPGRGHRLDRATPAFARTAAHSPYPWEAKLEIVTGTSMGAVIGGCYAAGQLDALAEWAMGLTRRRVQGYLDVSLSVPESPAARAWRDSSNAPSAKRSLEQIAQAIEALG